MSDIALFKIENKFNFSTSPKEGAGIIANLIPGKTTAIGFDLSSNQKTYRLMPWSFVVKIVSIGRYGRWSLATNSQKIIM